MMSFHKEPGKLVVNTAGVESWIFLWDHGLSVTSVPGRSSPLGNRNSGDGQRRWNALKQEGRDFPLVFGRC